MFDAFLAIGNALAATLYLGYWFTADTPHNLAPAAWSMAFSLYAYRVHRLKRRLSEDHVGRLLKALREAE
jgi:hypothetical protein